MWLQLKLNMLPSIAAEIKSKINEYHDLVNNIDESETTNANRNAELLQDYARLRAAMKARMEELAQFYDDNLDDEKAIFFENLRMHVKKCLHNRPGKRN